MADNTVNVTNAKKAMESPTAKAASHGFGDAEFLNPEVQKYFGKALKKLGEGIKKIFVNLVKNASDPDAPPKI
ncbi:MAG: hypothetical protein ABIH00_04600 [Armatimonadota bacterium]